jgi:hypothetical protein
VYITHVTLHWKLTAITRKDAFCAISHFYLGKSVRCALCVHILNSAAWPSEPQRPYSGLHCQAALTVLLQLLLMLSCVLLLSVSVMTQTPTRTMRTGAVHVCCCWVYPSWRRRQHTQCVPVRFMCVLLLSVSVMTQTPTHTMRTSAVHVCCCWVYLSWRRRQHTQCVLVRFLCFRHFLYNCRLERLFKPPPPQAVTIPTTVRTGAATCCTHSAELQH